MLDPTRSRINLLQLTLREAADGSVTIVKNRPRTRRPLIQCKNVFHNLSSAIRRSTVARREPQSRQFEKDAAAIFLS